MKGIRVTNSYKAFIDETLISDQSGLRPVLPTARYQQRLLQEGSLVLFLRRRSYSRLQRERRARRGGQGASFSVAVIFRKIKLEGFEIVVQ